MIPMVMRMDIRERERTRVRLWLPLFIVWLILLALAVAALPFLLIAALAARGAIRGRRVLPLIGAAFGVLNAMSGLRVDVDSSGTDKVYISFT